MSSLVVNQDGRPEFFVIGNDKAVWHQWTDSTGTWGPWTSMGGQWKQLDVIANQDGRLEVFTIGMDDAVWHRWQTTPNGSFSGWSTMKGQWKRLTVAANQDGRLEVFTIGMDDAVWHCWQTTPNGSFSGWSTLKGKWKQLGASRQPNGAVQVIGLGFDDESYRISQVVAGGSWGSWQKVFMGALPADFLSLTDSIELRLTSSSDSSETSLIMSLANREPPQPDEVTQKKTTMELSGECALEFAKATLGFAKAYDSSKRGNIVETLAAIEVTANLMTSAANKCAEAVQQGIDDTSSDGSDSPDKDGVRGLEGGRHWDYVPGPSDGKIQVA
jgi:tellurite resistance-related uncharacterized protein